MKMLVAIALAILSADSPGTGRQPPESDKPAVGRWEEVSPRAPKRHEERSEEEDILSALGYLPTSERTQSIKTVTIADESRIASGMTLLLSAHDFVASLVDSEGIERHRWSFLFHEKFPVIPLRYQHMWFMAHMFSNGDLLVLQNGFGIFRLTRDSELIWGKTLFAHHDFAVGDDDEVYALNSRRRLIPEIDSERQIIDEYVTHISPTGEIVGSVSITDSLIRSGDANILKTLRAWLLENDQDVLHTNSIEVLDGRQVEKHPAFRKGNLLISCRSPNLVLVLDLRKEEVVWTLQGRFKSQHSASVLDNGNILLFDNQGEAPSSVVRELDPATGDQVWEYRGTEGEPFFSEWNGRCHRLDNGNTLIVESLTGRTFEVTNDGEIVWEYWNPHRAGRESHYIARIFEGVRVPSEKFEWLRTSGPDTQP